MKISYKWLREYIDINIPMNELANRLTMAGLEIEGIENGINGTDDKIFEVNVTPNRGDCLSVIGIAREISAITGIRLSPPQYNVTEDNWMTKDAISIKIDEPHICPRYTARIIKGVRIGESPVWLKEMLNAVDIKPINNVVDITNLVLIATGNPLHAFDYNKITGKQIIVRKAKDGERFVSLDKREYQLDKEMLVIADQTNPVALAGVIGGGNSEVSSETKDILLECAYFDPVSVRKTSKKIGIQTDSSYRFERGVDHESIINIIDTAASLIKETAGGNIGKGVIDIYPKVLEKIEIPFRLERLNKILGKEIGHDIVVDILTSLGCTIKDRELPIIKVTVPAFRKDITREIDLIEEVSRIYGYDKIDPIPPSCSLSLTHKRDNRDIGKKIKDSLAMKGFNEVINFSFISYEWWEKIINRDRCDPIMIKNPLSKEWDMMRISLIPGLLQVLSTNLKRGNSDLKIFELGKRFYNNTEETMLGFTMTKRRDTDIWIRKGDDRSIFDAKGVLEYLSNYLDTSTFQFTKANIAIFKKRVSFNIILNGEIIGSIGQIDKEILERLDIKDDIYMSEISVERAAKKGNAIKASAVPKYPSINIDVAFVVDRAIKNFDVINVIKEDIPALLKDIKIFDYYEGKPLPAGKKNLGYTLTYRSDERTLTFEEVEFLHNKVIERVKKKVGAEFRIEG